MAWPITSSGPAGAVVDATRMTHGLDLIRCCRQRATEFSSSVQESTKLALTPNRSSRCRMMFSNNWRARSPLIGISVENSNSGGTHRPRLQNRAALLEDADDGFQLVLGDGKWSALDGGDALAGHRVD